MEAIVEGNEGITWEEMEDSEGTEW
jgi:hypothetical protein